MYSRGRRKGRVSVVTAEKNGTKGKERREETNFYCLPANEFRNPPPPPSARPHHHLLLLFLILGLSLSLSLA